MSTIGNPHVGDDIATMEVTDPTLGNGDGTYDVTFTSIRLINGMGDVLGASWTGTQKVSVDSVSGNTVTVLFESADAADSYVAESDGAITGTLEVNVKP
jgi:hypothetical protein